MSDQEKKAKSASGLTGGAGYHSFFPEHHDGVTKDHLRFENLFLELSAVLVNAPEENLETELNGLLKKFVEFLEVDRGIVIEYLDNPESAGVLMQYTVPGIDVPELAEFYVLTEGEIAELKKGIIIRAEKIPDDLPEMFHKGLIEKEKTKSLVFVPLSVGRIVIGNLTFASYRKEREWSDDMVKRIQFIGDIFANAILRIRSHKTLLKEIKRRQIFEERYSSILKTANVGFWITDMELNILVVNDEYCRMSGYGRDELLSMKIPDIDITFNEKDERIREEITGAGAIHHEAIHIKKDGSYMDMDVSSTLNVKEGILYSFMRDITELNEARKKQDERLEFEGLVSEFSAALINIKLDELVKELEKWIIRFVDFLGIGRGVINEYEYDKNIIKAIVNYTAPDTVADTSPHDNDLKAPDAVMNEFKKGTMIRAEKIPEDLQAPFRGWIIEKHNTKSLVVVPLISESRIIGNLTLAGYKTERKWPDDIFSRIKLIGEIIANAILRLRAYEALNKAQQELEERLEFEEVISEFSAVLINIRPDDIETELGNWLAKFVEIVGADRCGVNEYREDQKIIKNLMQYSVPEADISIPDLRETPEGEIKELEKGIIKAEKIPEDLPPMFQGGFIDKTKAKSLIIVPLLTGNRIFGNMAFTSYRKERKWSDELIRRIKLIAEIVGNAILRLRSHEALIKEMERRHLLEARYSSIIKVANVGFMISDLNANILEVNDAYCEMCGYSRDELINMKIYQLDVSGDTKKVDKDKDGIFEKGSFHHETSHIRKDGRVINVLISANLLQKEGMICCFIRDVTELKIARKDLEERLRFEALTSEFSAALINLKLEKMEEELDPWVKRYVEFFNVERGIVNEYEYDRNRINVISTYTDPDVDVPPTDKSNQAPESIMAKLAQGSIIKAEKIPQDLPPVFNESVIRRHNTKSIVIVPLSAENQIIGNLVFTTYTKEHKWPEEIIRRIRLIGEIIANAILRKRSNEALILEMKSRHMLEEKYTSIIKNASVGFTISDQDQNILDVNDEYCRMSGYTRDELTKMKISDIDFSKSYKKVDRDIDITVDSGIYHHQSKHIRKDGSMFDVDVHSQYSENEGFFFSFVSDVTELNKAKRELEDRLRFEELTSEFSAALVNAKIEKAKTELDVWLKRVSELLNVDRCAIGEYSSDYRTYRFVCKYSNPILDDEQKKFPEVIYNDGSYGLERYLVKGEAIQLESPNDRLPEDLTKWKNEVIAEGTQSILMLPLISGETLLGSMVFSTMTHLQKWDQDLVRRLRLVSEIYANTLMRDRTDQELTNYQSHLERMVEERTARLEEAQKELVMSEKMATLGRVTATVSHELRNPLGTIKSSVFYVQKRLKNQDEKIIKAMDRADRSITRCDLIISELLDYSRARSLQLETTPIDDWINDVLKETKPPSGISIKKELKSGAKIRMDQERFRQCMVNILTNAYQAIQEKGEDEPGLVSVVTKKDDTKLIIAISDNGIGFDMKNKEKLFEPPYSTKAFGVGLGISITRQIIEQHGWQIDLTGEPGKGASVSISIPF